MPDKINEEPTLSARAFLAATATAGAAGAGGGAAAFGRVAVALQPVEPPDRFPHPEAEPGHDRESACVALTGDVETVAGRAGPGRTIAMQRQAVQWAG
jgi:hypothetical protein